MGSYKKEDAEEATIDEIKGVLRDLEHLTRPVSVHLRRQNVMRICMPNRQA